MRKGVFFTMDAVYAFYIMLLVMSITMIILEANTNYSDDPLALTRLAKDVYEVRKYDSSMTLPSFVLEGSACDGKALVASVQSFVYGNIQEGNAWTKNASASITSERICYG